MAIDDKIRDEKLRYEINREAATYLLKRQIQLISMSTLLVKK